MKYYADMIVRFGLNLVEGHSKEGFHGFPKTLSAKAQYKVQQESKLVQPTRVCSDTVPDIR